jgi:hypothetical protein
MRQVLIENAFAFLGPGGGVTGLRPAGADAGEGRE